MTKHFYQTFFALATICIVSAFVHREAFLSEFDKAVLEFEKGLSPQQKMRVRAEREYADALNDQIYLGHEHRSKNEMINRKLRGYYDGAQGAYKQGKYPSSLQKSLYCSEFCYKYHMITTGEYKKYRDFEGFTGLDRDVVKMAKNLKCGSRDSCPNPDPREVEMDNLRFNL